MKVTKIKSEPRYNLELSKREITLLYSLGNWHEVIADVFHYRPEKEEINKFLHQELYEKLKRIV